jgi:ABC-type transport system involved in cytochrome c biogenesis ATPase subunit
MIPAPLTPWRFMRFLFCWQFFTMVALIFVEATFSAIVTYFIIQAGKDIATGDFKVFDFVWILAAQAGSYVLHGISWIFGEQAGFGAYARYMMQFTRDNRHHTELLHAKDVREEAEPFLTSEAFHLFFELMYELEGALQLFFGLILSALVIGAEIDEGFPLAYAVIFVLVMALQYTVRKPIERVSLNNQKMTNRMTAQTYTAWDNITSGNLYNFRLWHTRFKDRLRAALRAQINAILLREGVSSVSGVIGLIVIFGVMAWVVSRDVGDLPLLVALAATLPKQIDMTHEVHTLAIGWNDMLALWTRAKGVVAHMQPRLLDEEGSQQDVSERIKYDKLVLREGDTVISTNSIAHILSAVRANPIGRINVRGENGAGKSTLLVALRLALKGRAYYWPTADRLAFEFTHVGIKESDDDVEEDDVESAEMKKRMGFSSGEQQLAALTEIVNNTQAQIYLLDEWDANLDTNNRANAKALIDQLAQRARVVEISHRDTPIDTKFLAR